MTDLLNLFQIVIAIACIIMLILFGWIFYVNGFNSLLLFGTAVTLIGLYWTLFCRPRRR